MTTLLPLGDAQQLMISKAKRLPVHAVPLEHARGRYLAEDLPALRSQPAANMSAMDGYAVRGDDLTGPWKLLGECQAGRAPCDALNNGETARIFTGALLPDGAAAVIMQEHIIADSKAISLPSKKTIETGANIRQAKSDFAEGQMILPRGTEMSPARLGLATMAGYAELSVARAPRIAIISTGDELVAPGQLAMPHQIPSSNDIMVGALIKNVGATVTSLPRINDTQKAVEAALHTAADHDLIITIGGASVGDHDFVLPALKSAGGAVDFWKIAMKPGKPMMFGKLGNALVLGLPGNPVSAFITATLFALPLIRYLAGAKDYLPSYADAKSGSALPATSARAEFLRAYITDGIITPYNSHDSARLSILGQANALLYRAANAPELPEGAPVKYIAI